MSHVVADGQHVLEQQVSSLKSYLLSTHQRADGLFLRNNAQVVSPVASQVIWRLLKWRRRRGNDGGARGPTDIPGALALAEPAASTQAAPRGSTAPLESWASANLQGQPLRNPPSAVFCSAGWRRASSDWNVALEEVLAGFPPPDHRGLL